MNKTVTNNWNFVISVDTESKEYQKYYKYYEDLKFDLKCTRHLLIQLLNNIKVLGRG